MQSASADKGVISPDMRNLIGAKAYEQQEDGATHITLRRKSPATIPPKRRGSPAWSLTHASAAPSLPRITARTNPAQRVRATAEILSFWDAGRANV